MWPLRCSSSKKLCKNAGTKLETDETFTNFHSSKNWENISFVPWFHPKGPTSREEREKWGTRLRVPDLQYDLAGLVWCAGKHALRLARLRKRQD